MIKANLPTEMGVLVGFYMKNEAMGEYLILLDSTSSTFFRIDLYFDDYTVCAESTSSCKCTV